MYILPLTIRNTSIFHYPNLYTLFVAGSFKKNDITTAAVNLPPAGSCFTMSDTELCIHMKGV